MHAFLFLIISIPLTTKKWKILGMNVLDAMSWFIKSLKIFYGNQMTGKAKFDEEEKDVS